MQTPTPTQGEHVMARLPVLRRRRSKAEQALDLIQKAAKTYTSLKIAKAGPKAARAAARGYAGVKTAKVGARAARRAVTLAAVLAAVAGGVAVWRKRRHTHTDASDDFDRPLGPVAAPGVVSPPAPIATGDLSDTPA
jgi:hypothetical protein